MRTIQEIHLASKPLVGSFKNRYASEKDCSKRLSGEFVLYVDGCLAGAQLNISQLEQFKVVSSWAHFIETDETFRSSGMPTNSKTFGHMPRRPLGRGDYCAMSQMHDTQPDIANMLMKLGAEICTPYQAWFPFKYNDHNRNVQDIRPEYRLTGVFTSGIVNRDNKLAYHYDAGNVKDCWSGMVTFKRHCSGGNLACPEIDAVIENFDGSLLLFDGQSLLHGVTDFVVGQGGHRVTVVYYSLSRLWECLPFSDELKRAREKRDQMELVSACEIALTAPHDDVVASLRDKVLTSGNIQELKELLEQSYGLSAPASELGLRDLMNRAISGIETLPVDVRKKAEAYLAARPLSSLRKNK